MRGTKTATILVIVGTGSKYENKANNGISHFLEHMFFKGTKKRSNTLAIAGELDKVGSEYNAFTAKEFTGYWVKVDSNKINKTMDARIKMPGIMYFKFGLIQFHSGNEKDFLSEILSFILVISASISSTV